LGETYIHTQNVALFKMVTIFIRREFEDKIIYLKYERLKNELEATKKNELEATNEEINIHKEQVIEIISKYGFPPEMEILLLEIDELLESNLQSINGGMISNLRHFFELFVENVAGKIKDITKDEYPKNPEKK
jgi:hypothetical protein